jgi:alpha-galactosidase
MKNFYAALCIFLLAIPCLAQNQPAARKMLATTPPMGWNSWNKFHMKIDDAIVRTQADAMVSTGMKAAGYQYINIDEGWEGARDAQGNLSPNQGFPDMKALAAYVHSKGLKLGIYTSPGPKACGGSEGSYGHEEQDARLFASWNIDYVKYDWCTAGTVYSEDRYPLALQKMAAAIAATGRPMVYSIHGRGAVWKYSAAAGAQLWRTTGDIRDDYNRMIAIGFAQKGLERYAGPGHWNDPDMMEVGNGGMKDNEYRMHMSLWCLLAAPLIAGNDLTAMSPETLAILTNAEAIAVDQDARGIQGRTIYEEGPVAVIEKPLADGSHAVGLFNREQGTIKVSVSFSDLGLGENATVRDLWQHKDLGSFHGVFSADIPQHSAVLLRIH